MDQSSRSFPTLREHSVACFSVEPSVLAIFVDFANNLYSGWTLKHNYTKQIFLTAIICSCYKHGRITIFALLFIAVSYLYGVVQRPVEM